MKIFIQIVFVFSFKEDQIVLLRREPYILQKLLSSPQVAVAATDDSTNTIPPMKLIMLVLSQKGENEIEKNKKAKTK